MMKRLLFFFSFLFVALMGHAEAGSLVLENNLSIKPGEQKEIKFLLNNVNPSSAAQATIVLPEGLSFVKMDWDGDEVWAIPADRAVNAFSDATMAVDGSVTFAFLATAARNRIAPSSEDPLLLTMTIKAADNAPTGIATINLNDVVVSYPAGSESVNEDYSTQANINIYQTYNVTVAANDAKMGSVTGGNAEAMSGVELTVTATANTGYEFVNWTDDTNTEVSANAVYKFTPTTDVTLTANFKASVFKATFISEGKSEDKDIAFGTPLSDATIGVIPGEKTGYTFQTWGMPETMPAANQTFTAQYTINQYTMTFRLDNGEEDVVKTQNYDSDLTAPTGFTKAGYTFKGWDKVVPAKVPASSETFTAQWEAITYNITYDLKSGALPEGKTNPATYNVETETFTLNNPEREGYTFAGWTGTGLTEPTTSVSIAKGSTGDRNYTATWTPVEYTITYNLDGGALAEGVSNPSKYTAETATFTLNNPAKTGYTFAGWTGTGLTEATTNVSIAKGSMGNRSYTATWTVNQYQVTFIDPLKEENNGVISSQQLDFGSAIVAPSDPVHEGFNFSGWSPAVDATVPAHDVTYTAQYGDVFSKVTYKLNGEVFEVIDNVKFGTSPVPAPTKIVSVPLGFQFDGWQDVPASMPAHDITIEGTTSHITYTITYELAGGTNNAQNPAVYYVNSLDITLGWPTRDGYDFVGWVGTDVPTAQLDVTIPTGSVGNRSYTAVWSVKTYTITYDLAGGALAEGVTNPETYTVESNDFTLNNPTKKGHTFAGWTGTGLTQATTPVTIAQGSTGDRSYTATWTPNNYIVTFIVKREGQIDEIVSMENKPYGTAITYPATDPEWTGHTFIAWTPDVTPGEGMTVPDSNITFTSAWDQLTRNITYMLDGEVYETIQDVAYGTTLTAIADPQPREGYTFSGWSGLPATMPAYDVTVEGSFNINQYTMTFMVDDEIYYEQTLDYGSQIVLPNDPQKDRMIFTGWDPEVPATVPATNQTFTAQFVPAAFTAIFLDGDQFGNAVIVVEDFAMGEPVYEPDAPEHEGYTFTGWKPVIPDAMPDHDVTYVAQFVINKYVISYYVDGKLYKEDTVEYGAPVVLNGDYEWEGELYETMPAYDIEYTYETSPAVQEEETVDFTEDIDETTDLDGTLVGDLYFNIGEEDGGYDAEEQCIVITSSTSDSTVDGIESGTDPNVKKDFTGIIFKVPAGYGFVKVTAATIGNKVMKVKFGDDDALEYQTEGKEDIIIEYKDLTEDTYVYIYADDSAAGVKGINRAEEKADGEVRIYAIKVSPFGDGIQGLRDGVTSDDAAVYTLGGQKMNSGSKLPRGIYVINGKKVQVR